MIVEPVLFGKMPCGEPVFRLEIAGGGLTAAILTYGAVLQELRLEGFAHSLVLGLNRLEDYIAHSPYFGAIAGRVANRIAFGRFTLDGTNYRVNRNVDGIHTLHGGEAGIGLLNWQIVETGSDFVLLEICSPDGDMGFPGNMVVRCRYQITPNAKLRVELTAKSDAPTLCNLAHHSYFILAGEGDILDHELMIDASEITAVNDQLIPTGELLPVEDTIFDFRKPRRISSGAPDGSLRFDHNYCLSTKSVELRRVAELRSSRTGIVMRLATTAPGLQFYDGAKVQVPVSGIDGRSYRANAGLCLEAQHWPDAANHAGFPSIVLKPDQQYRQISEFRFSLVPIHL